MQWIIFAILVYCLIVFLHLNFGDAQIHARILYLIFPFITTILYVCNCYIVWSEKIIDKFKRTGLFLGAISYALYLFHYMIRTLVLHFDWSTTSAASFMIISSILLASLLEQKFQPWIVHHAKNILK